MFFLRTRTKRRDDEVGSSTNSNPQPPQPQLFLHLPTDPAGEGDGPRRILPHPDTNHSLVSPVNQPLAGRVPNASNTLLEPRVLTVPTVPVVSTSVLPHEPRSLLTDPHPHPPSHLVSSLPARAGGPDPCPTSPVGSIIAHVPGYTASYNHLESWNVGFTDMELESEAQLLKCTHPAASGAELCLWNRHSGHTQSD